ncbi:MAG: AsmA family protein, partial [Gammaproteobacteria bacterium]
VVVSFVIFIWTLDINQYKPELEQMVSTQTGRDFRISGDMQITPSLSPIISVNGISLSNADWSNQDQMLTAERVEARISLLPLLSGTIHINTFILHDTLLQLEKNTDGSGNWELETLTAVQDGTAPPVSPEPEVSRPLPPINIDEIDIRNVRIVYQDRQAGTSNEFNISEISTSVTGLDTPMNIRIVASYDQIPLIISGTVGPLATLLADETYSLDLDGSLDRLGFSLSGSITNPMQARGADFDFSLDLDSLADLNDIAEAELPDIGPFTAGGNIEFDTPDRVSISNFTSQLDESDLAGTFNAQLDGDTPLLTARLSSALIDLSGFASEEEAQERPEFLFPREELPLAGLSAVNADVSLTVVSLKLPSIDLDNADLALTLQDGNLQTSASSGIAGGSVSAVIELQNNNGIANLITNINGTEIMLEQLPHEQETWFTGGPVELQIDGNGQGQSIAGIMGSFNGKFLVQVGQATMPNRSIDMVGADLLLSVFNRFNPFADQEEISVLECAVINLDIRDGLITVDRQIAMQTAKMNMVGSGEINLITEQLSLGMKPYAREGVGLNLNAISGVARIGGTLANPKPEIDPKGTLAAGASAGAA